MYISTFSSGILVTGFIGLWKTDASRQGARRGRAGAIMPQVLIKADENITLTKGKFALVDDEDYEKVSQLSWKYTGGYAAHNYTVKGKQGCIYMHRLIMNAKKGEFVDHVNHDPLDNRRTNLRLCTHSQNHMNRTKLPNRSSRYKGVTWNKQVGKWKASIQAKGKYRYIGYFDKEHHAALAYDMWAKPSYGEFANLNLTPVC